MANDFPIRETSALVKLFQRAHTKASALQRLDDQIATLVAQHQRLQDEVRAVQHEINEEFARTLRFNQAPAKLNEPAETTAAAGSDPVTESSEPESGNSNRAL